MKKHIPNTITSLSLLCGLTAIHYALKAEFNIVFMLIVLSAIFDFADGFAARLLNAKSDIGLQLDSLVDMVSFGVAPAFVMFTLIRTETAISIGSLNSEHLAYIAFLLPVSSALRLAKFNIDTTQRTYFKGLPTPANALFFVSLPFLIEQIGCVHPGLLSILLIIIFSFLMVSSVKMFSLKIQSLKLKDNYLIVILMALALITGVIMQSKAAIPIIILLYIIESAILFRKPE